VIVVSEGGARHVDDEDVVVAMDHMALDADGDVVGVGDEARVVERVCVSTSDTGVVTAWATPRPIKVIPNAKRMTPATRLWIYQRSGARGIATPTEP
jgi:hypothetical protein